MFSNMKTYTYVKKFSTKSKLSIKSVAVVCKGNYNSSPLNNTMNKLKPKTKINPNNITCNTGITTAFQNKNSFLFDIKKHFSKQSNNETKQSRLFSLFTFPENNFIIGQDKINLKNKGKQFKKIVEMRDDVYTLVKMVRMFSFFVTIPYNALLALSSIELYTLDGLISHAFDSFVMILVPYIFTENFVVEIKYDEVRNQLHITKLNFYCKLTTRVHNVRDLVRVNQKYTLRPFTYFRNKSTNEYFSIRRICKINDMEMLDSLVPEKVVKRKERKENNKNLSASESANSRLIDSKMNKNIFILDIVKGCLVSYLVAAILFIYLKIKEHKKMKQIEQEQDK